MSRIFNLKFWITLILVVSLAAGFFLETSLPAGMIYGVDSETREYKLTSHTGYAVPVQVLEAANELGNRLYSRYQQRYDQFVDQLLGMYLSVQNADVAIIFNPGGWGWAPLDKSPGWVSISQGIVNELRNLGYSSNVLFYQRTEPTLNGKLDESVSMLSFKSSRAEDLAFRLDFLTRFLPDLRIIVAGESTGTVYCDHVMTILKNNPQVLSIQTGPPFWHKYVTEDRTLLIKSNQEMMDSFTQGDLLGVVCANLEKLFGFTREQTGTIMSFFQAPGHVYDWDPFIAGEITGFLKANFPQNYD